MTDKPNILGVIGQRIELRRVGKEHIGLCPFHNDRHPSLYVNESKRVFLCRACGERGDVIAFIMKLEGLSFPEAKLALGMGTDCPPSLPLTPGRKHSAEIAAAWVNEQRAKLNVMLADTMYYRDLADEVGAFDLAESFEREIILLREFYATLAYPRGAAEMLALRESIEQITAGAEVSL